MSATDSLLALTWHAIDRRQSVISITPDQFRWQMVTLAEHGLRGISLEQAFEQRALTGRFPEDCVVLTFDDGYQSILDEAFPVMQELGFGGTIFVITGMVGLGAGQVRSKNPFVDRDLMGWSELAELAGGGLEIASHSVSHPDLTCLDPQSLENELRESREMLEQKLQRSVASFAYPFGGFNPTVCKAVSAHYRLACTTQLGRQSAAGDALLIRRADIYFLRRRSLFRRLIAGRLDGYLQVRQQLRDVKTRMGGGANLAGPDSRT
jgi:peptidoglycan/xylan/chitin deacetylase (PgdA/CDA1 family)